MNDDSLRNNEFWRDKLSPQEYKVCREKGTDRAFTGEYWDTKVAGTYRCRCCATPLFKSDAKYDSGSGWPSFYQALDPLLIKENVDRSLGMERIEVVCAKCDCHLGHLFPDGPAPTGMRYCVNSSSITLDTEKSESE
ncbi:peptide-methionine (R)-S-oxide reductase MsrB [Agarilytica rhodophyticola]|uniref:peptide-methionine (R)-S-oxide reductase MsrB n=1 Tax=Agarilytica rhodophyticola TaxID=1737490 RepID=UPI000B348ED0|nr:peptide-methionine (R)-S-oxide reductase MsrB [Agarilytica rhodophyticola]